MNLAEMIDHLKSVDEISLLELLNITSEDLVDAFYDRIEEREEVIRRDIQEYD